MKISFSTLACPDWSWSEILDRGPTYGYDGVEVRLLAGDINLLNVPVFAVAERDQRRQELQARNFAVCGLASSVRFDYVDPHVRNEQLQIGKAYIELASQLGASFVRVFGDVLPLREDVAARQTVLANIAAGLQKLGEFAEPIGIGVLIETHGDFSDSRLMHELMQQIHSPAVGVLWDTHHPWRFHGEPLQETFDLLKPWIRHTHWKDSVTRPQRKKDAAAEAADEQARKLMSGHRPADYVLFGGGEFPAIECYRVLQAGGYDGWFSLEWEKAWHPEIEDPEISLPLFPQKMKDLQGLSGNRALS